MNLTIVQAQRLAEGVRCPTCGGRGNTVEYEPPPQQLLRCTTCDGKGRVFWKEEWPQLVWVKDIKTWRTQYYEQGDYERTIKRYGMAYYPAPDPIRVLMWLRDMKVFHLKLDGEWSAWRNGWGDYSDTDPSALLDAVLEALK